jgi:spermidine synthase
MIVQSESPRYNTEVFQEIYECFRSIFGSDQVHCYLISVPTYPTGNWSLAFCAKGNIHPLRNIDLNKIKAFSEKEGLKYYNEDIHVAAFALPNYVRNLLNEKVTS